jgi:hypothetical protein
MDSNRSYNSSTKLLVNPNLNQAAYIYIYIYMHVLASRPKMQRFGPFIFRPRVERNLCWVACPIAKCGGGLFIPMRN